MQSVSYVFNGGWLVCSRIVDTTLAQGQPRCSPARNFVLKKEVLARTFLVNGNHVSSATRLGQFGLPPATESTRAPPVFCAPPRLPSTTEAPSGYAQSVSPIFKAPASWL